MHQTDIPILHLQNIKPLCMKQIFQCCILRNIETLCMEGGMGDSAHASNRYSNSSPSKTLKLSAWKEVLVHMHKSDIPMLQLETH